MSVSVYTRHSPECAHADDIYYRRCRCTKYIQGVLDSGKHIRKSAKTRSWEKAEKIARGGWKNQLLVPSQLPDILSL
jgi:integrase/recombinase XerD